MRNDIRIGDVSLGKVKSFTLSFPDRPVMPTMPASFCTGRFTVEGTLTTYFENPALLEAILGKPRKAMVWPMVAKALLWSAVLLLCAIIPASGAL